jgi:hypothetical protein
MDISSSELICRDSLKAGIGSKLVRDPLAFPAKMRTTMSPSARFGRGLFAVGLALAATLPARAADPEIRHDKIVEPRIANPVDPALGQIGLPMSFSVVGKQLIVGGSKGLAAVDETGKVLWTLELQQADARQVAADDSGVAFTSFDVGGVDRSGPLSSNLLGGELMAKPEFVNATVGLADTQGELLWSVKTAEQAKLSPPSLSGKAVGVVGVRTFALYDRASGKAVAEPVSVFTSVLGLTDGLVAQWPSRAAVVAGDVFHVVRNNFYKRVDAAGKELDSTRTVGLMTPLEYLPAGPVLWKNRVFFANSPSERDKQPLLMAAKVGGGFDWNDRMDAGVKTGLLSSSQDTPMDIAVNSGNVFVATNFTLLAYTGEGKSLWRAKNDKGGLFPSALRGARYIGNAFERKAPVPKSYLAAPMLVATDERVYLATSYTESSAAAAATDSAASRADGVVGSESKPVGRKGDAITVLDAKNGTYVESIWFPDVRIIGMTVFGQQLAVATSEGVKMLALK